MISEYFDTNNVSKYQPDSPDIIQITKEAKYAFDLGYTIIKKNWPELNNRSVKEDEQNGKRLFNAYVDESDDDPFTSWQWKGTRSEARKRGVAMHAQLTAGFLFANISAQDDDSNEDRAAGDFMRGLVEWMAENSEYAESFIKTSMGLITNPVTFMGAEFAQVSQKVRKILDSGEVSIKEVIDSELSGFRCPVYSSTEVLITNAYVPNIQRQTCILKIKYLDYHDAEKKYGKKDNWQFVSKGHNTVFNESDNTFYDVYDSENPNSVMEVICSWRGIDLEVPFVAGIYMGDENVDKNRIKHRDIKDQPKYDVIPFGYSRISEHFFYYKSLMNILQWENNFYDEFSRNVMNRELLDLIPPTISKGDEDGTINTSVIFPGANITSKSKDFSIQPILPPASGNRYQALNEVRKSIEDSSISDINSGQLPEATQKATAIVQSTQSGKTLLKGIGRALGESIVQYTRLMVDIAVNHYSIPQIQEITGGVMKDRYRQFILPNKIFKGKSIGKVLRFDGDLVGTKMSPTDKEMYSMKLLEESGFPDTKSSIIVMNPEMAARMNYLISYNADDMFQQNQTQMQLMLQNMYGQLRQDPLVDAEALLREYMYAFFRSKGDDFIVKNPKPVMPGIDKGLGQEVNKMPTPVPSPVGGL